MVVKKRARLKAPIRKKGRSSGPMVKPEDLEAFWQTFFGRVKQTRPTEIGARISEIRKRTAIPLNEKTLATVREFPSPALAQEYPAKAKSFYQGIIRARPKTFILVPIKLLDVRGRYVLEKVYPALSIYELTDSKQNMFREKFIESISRRKSINLRQLTRKAVDAHKELVQIIQSRGLKIDTAEGNVLVMDYSRRLGKVFIGVVDFLPADLGGSIKTI